ncbi:MAG: hypothetical protein EHM81_04890, partial [Chloroflexi bacterium]
MILPTPCFAHFIIHPSNFILYNTTMLTVVIQAGGNSSRMGQDKALLPFLGQPLIR